MRKTPLKLGKVFPGKTLIGLYMFAIVAGLGISYWQVTSAQTALVAEVNSGKSTEQLLLETKKTLEEKLAQDPYAENERLKKRQDLIHDAIADLGVVFEQRTDLVASGGKVDKIDPMIVQMLAQLNKEDYDGAQEVADKIKAQILALTPTPKPAVITDKNVPEVSGPANSGYQRVNVVTGRGTFTVAILIAPGARAVVDTASDADCKDNCPVLALAEYVSRNGGFAGINGAYFCPPDYAVCQGKTNSFDTLAVNGRTKAVLNRDNNVYSTVPLVAMYGGSISFYNQTLQWGADTSSNGGLANYPILLRDGNVQTDNNASKGTRGFIGVKDGAPAIGHVFGASYADTAEVLKTLGLQNAMNLDGGGSSALYVDGGYRVGPGRLLPTAIVLVR